MTMTWNKFSNRGHFRGATIIYPETDNQFFDNGLFIEYRAHFLGSVFV